MAELADLAREHEDALLAIKLDVTDRGAVFETVARAHEHFGQIHIVVNNAGYCQFGMVEELSEAEARDQIETNLFGALWVTQAAWPFLREQGSGHFLQVSSIGARAAASSQRREGSKQTARRGSAEGHVLDQQPFVGGVDVRVGQREAGDDRRDSPGGER